MDPVSIIGIISGVIAIAGAFKKGTDSFEKWRKERKAKKTAEEELQNSLEEGGPTVKSEYDKHLKKYGEIFGKGDEISKLCLMTTAMHLDLAVVDVLIKFAMAPRQSTGLDLMALWQISEQARKGALRTMAEFCQRIHIQAPILRSLGGGHQQLHRPPSPAFSTSRFAAQPRDAYTFGTAESIQDEADQREESALPPPAFVPQPVLDTQNYRNSPGVNYSPSSATNIIASPAATTKARLPSNSSAASTKTTSPSHSDPPIVVCIDNATLLTKPALFGSPDNKIVLRSLCCANGTLATFCNVFCQVIFFSAEILAARIPWIKQSIYPY